MTSKTTPFEPHRSMVAVRPQPPENPRNVTSCINIPVPDCVARLAVLNRMERWTSASRCVLLSSDRFEIARQKCQCTTINSYHSTKLHYLLWAASSSSLSLSSAISSLLPPPSSSPRVHSSPSMTSSPSSSFFPFSSHSTAKSEFPDQHR